MQPITTAVILATGLGTRLRDTFSGKPKGLLSVGGVPLVERSIQQLQTHGIDDIIIVTGYLSEAYEAFAETHPAVRTLNNPSYADSGSMYSLYCVHEVISEPFLLLESDLLYENRALSKLLAAPGEDAILTSGFTRSGDEVYIEERDSHFAQMSKDRSQLQNVVGELVGICKLSTTLFDKMLVHAEAHFQKSRHMHYEDCFNKVATEVQIPLCLVPDLLWTEIDNAAHLHHVESVIWPQIQQKEQQNEGL